MLASVLSLSLLGPAPSAGPEVLWRGEPGCVDTEQVTSRITALMGRPSPAVVLELQAAPEGDQWRVELTVRSTAQAFDRTLLGRDCQTLTHAVALILAVQLDPIAVADAVWPPSTAEDAADMDSDSDSDSLGTTAPPIVPDVPALTSPPAPSPGSTRAPPSPPESTPIIERPSRRPRVRGLLGVAAMAELGVHPRGAAAFELTTGVAWPRARVELGGLISAGPDGTATDRPSVGGRFRLFTGLVRGCGLAATGRFSLPLCAGIELGDLRATGTGLRQPAVVDALWLAAVGSARPRWSLRPRLALGALLDLIAPLRRHRFATQEAGPVHEVDPVAARLGAHLELRFP